MSAGESGSERRRSHVVISAPSQWGQQACDHLLHRAVAHGGRVTLIVPRRHQAAFKTWKPTIGAWKEYASLEACLDGLKASGRPVDYVYDDHLNHLAAELIAQRREQTHLTVGYVASSAEDHLPHAEFLVELCERVLIEKPVSRIYAEIIPEGRLCRLVQAAESHCRLQSAEHYLFRPGVTEARARLKEFLGRHSGCDLCYQFNFEEAAGRDDPTTRLPAYQDGSIMDVLAPHGLGPVVRLLMPALGFPAATDLYASLELESFTTWQALTPEPKPTLKVPVLAETAAALAATLSRPGPRSVPQVIRILLRSAKGCHAHRRYFKFECPIRSCRYLDETQRRTAEEPPTFGVSLGAAGYTVLDYLRGDPSAGGGRLFREKDGGYLSDSQRGSSEVAEAANAQAAMLDALLGEEFERTDGGRFIPINTACQLIRFGLKVQGEAFCRKRQAYVWGTGPEWNKSSLEKAGARPLDDPRAPVRLKPSAEQINAVLGIAVAGDSPAFRYHRVVTVLGPEGAGNTDVALVLAVVIEKRSARPILIHVIRDEHWCAQTRSEPSRFTLERIVAQLAAELGITLRTAGKPTEALSKFFEEIGDSLTGEGVIVLNGVDRLAEVYWFELVRILSQLPPSYRLILVTNRWDRAAGFVVRTEDLITTPEFKAKTRLRFGAYSRLIQRQLKQADREHFDEIRRQIVRYSNNNLTVAKQLSSFVMYIALPRSLERRGDIAPTWRQEAFWRNKAPRFKGMPWAEVHQDLSREIACLSVPDSLVPFPERLLERISKACLDEIGREEREAIERLALMSGRLSDEVVEAALPGLFQKLKDHLPVRAVFEQVYPSEALLYPWVRRAALSASGEDLSVLRRRLERRRLMLSLGSAGDPERDERQVRLLYGADIESLHLGDGLFEDYCRRLLEKLETASDLHADHVAAYLIDLLSEKQKSNLGLLTRCRLLRLRGKLLLLEAGVDRARLHAATALLARAYHLAEFSSRHDHGWESWEKNDTLVLAMEGLVSAGLSHYYSWHQVFRVRTPPLPTEWEWEDFVRVGTANSPRASLWQLCGIDAEARALADSVDLSRWVRAAALRAMALYLWFEHRKKAA